MTHSKLAPLLYPIITLLALWGLWEAYLGLFKVPDYILPRPGAVLNAFVRAFYSEGYVWGHLAFTLQSTWWGYLAGCSAGIILGGLLAESRTFDRLFYPYLILLQAMPKVALAPLIIVWFGFDLASKVVMVALICFFPIFMNTIAGIRQADSDLVETLRAFSASRLHIFFQVKIPAAAGAIFAGLQISVVLGLIGAVVAEFVASRKGIGTMIASAATQLNTSVMLTGVFTLAVIGLIGNLIIRAIERRLVFWEAHSAETKTAMLREGQ
jgi:NitT/TauT family transport system permease protein